MRIPGRILMNALFAVALTGSHVGAAQNAPTTVGPVQLTIPERFEFVKSGRQDTVEVSAWTKGMGSTGTLLQVSIVDRTASAQAGSIRHPMSAMNAAV